MCFALNNLFFIFVFFAVLYLLCTCRRWKKRNSLPFPYPHQTLQKIDVNLEREGIEKQKASLERQFEQEKHDVLLTVRRCVLFIFLLSPSFLCFFLFYTFIFLRIHTIPSFPICFHRMREQHKHRVGLIEKENASLRKENEKLSESLRRVQSQNSALAIEFDKYKQKHLASSVRVLFHCFAFFLFSLSLSLSVCWSSCLVCIQSYVVLFMVCTN